MFKLLSLPAVVASRCCRFPLLSLPAVVASRLPLFVILAVVMAAPAVLAQTHNGTWSAPKTTYSGQGTQNSYWVPNTSTPWPQGMTGTIGPPNATSTQKSLWPSMSGTLDESGSVTFTWTWTPATAQDTPPASLSILVVPSASYSDGQGSWMGPFAGVFSDGAVSDGYNDPSSTTVIGTSTGAGNTSVTATGRHLVQVAVSGTAATLTVPLSAHTAVTCPQTTTGPYNASLYVGVSVSAAPDSRAVTISGGRATSKKVLSGGADANGDGLWKKVPNDFVNGTLSDDIAIPYGEKHNQIINAALVPVDSTVKVDATYTPSIYGPWATEGAQYLENSSAKNYNLQGTLGDPLIDVPPTAADIPRIKNTFVGPTIDDTNNGNITWHDAGVVDHVFFKFTNGDNRSMRPTAYPTGNDGDGAIASANYYLNIHRPLESFPSHVPSMYVYRIANAYPVAGVNPLTGQADIPMTIDAPGYATYGPDGTNGATIAVHLNNPDVSWDNTIDALAGIGSLPFPGEYAILDQIFTGASILIHYNKPDVETHTVAFNDGACWTDPWSTGQGTYPKSKYHMFPRFRVRYTRTYSLVDSYDMDGFESEKLTYYDKFLDNFSYFGYFQYVGASI